MSPSSREYISIQNLKAMQQHLNSLSEPLRRLWYRRTIVSILDQINSHIQIEVSRRIGY